MTVTATRAYAGSTDTVKTNKGTATNKAVTGSSTTLLVNATPHPQVDDTFILSLSQRRSPRVSSLCIQSMQVQLKLVS